MKKKFLALIPVTFLLFSCDFSFAELKEWWDNDGLTPKQKEDDKPEEKEDEGKEDEGGGEVTPEPEITYDIVIDSKSDYSFESVDDGYLHQMEVGDQVLDAIGYESSESSLGSIKKVTYGAYTFNGMVYNRSLINGLDKLCVTYSGGTLQYIFSEYLMQDMNFDEKTNNNVESGKALDVPLGTGYFVFYNKSETPITIESVKIKMSEEKVFDSKMVFNEETDLGNARSAAKAVNKYDSYIQLENNPTKYTNNYSTGKHEGHSNNDSWYRWNGKFFRDSDNLGTNFKLGMTVIGNLSQVVDESKYFHYAVWPQMGWRDGEDVLHSTNEDYVQTYIGNDNYEPLGKDKALRPSDPYVAQSYEGRFYTDYGFISAGYWCVWNNATNKDVKDSNNDVLHFESEDAATAFIDTQENKADLEAYEDGEYKFLDPDVTKTMDGKYTYRQAYEKYNLPFWFIEFDFSLNEKDMPVCDIYINGFHLFQQEVLADYDTVNKPGLQIHTMPMHLVNYGDAEGNPGPSYTGCFTYPRLMAK